MDIDPKTVRTLGARLDRTQGSAWRFANKVGTKKERDFALAMSYPSIFAKIVLGLDLSEKQAQAVDALRDAGSMVSVLAANGAGKTARILVVFALWHQFLFPGGKVKITSGSYTQIEDQIWPAFQPFKSKFPEWTWRETPSCDTRNEETKITGKEGFINCFTTNHPGRAEGDHNDGRPRRLSELLRSGEVQNPREVKRLQERLRQGDDIVDDGEYPLAYAVDEAKTSAEWLKKVIMGRVRPARLLLLSSSGFAEGWFYESQTSDPAFKKFKITADDCWWISKEDIANIRKTWEAVPEFAGSILGENFLSLVENAVIPIKALDENLANPPEENLKGDRHGFCDFAWSGSGDENVFALRRGNVITIEKCFRSDHLEISPKNPEPGIVEQFIREFKRTGFTELDVGHLSGDEGGGGKLVMDALDARGWYLNRVSNQAAPFDTEHYYNTAAETWYEGTKQITAKSFVLPKDAMLRGQLINRKQIPNEKGKLKIESKDDMRARNVPSPDRADAVLGCMAPTGGFGPMPVTWAIAAKMGDFKPTLEQPAEEAEVPEVIWD